MGELQNPIQKGMVTQKDDIVQFVVAKENVAQWRKLVLQAKEEARHCLYRRIPRVRCGRKFYSLRSLAQRICNWINWHMHGGIFENCKQKMEETDSNNCR